MLSSNESRDPDPVMIRCTVIYRVGVVKLTLHHFTPFLCTV